MSSNGKLPETEESLMKFLDNLIEEKSLKGQNLAYNTIKRRVSETFSDNFFLQHKTKVQDRLLLEGQRRRPKANVETREAQFEETEDKLLDVVNEFIAVKKSKNQNVSYPTIKRHILKHFSPEFFAAHKVMVQLRLENAFRRDPSNGQFIEDMQRNEGPAEARSRVLESIFANMEVVLADMKIVNPYPVTDRYDEVLRQVQDQIGDPVQFKKYELEIIAHLETFRASEFQAQQRAKKAAAAAKERQEQEKAKRRLKQRYFTDADHGSIFDERIAKPSERRRMTNVYAKSRSMVESHEENGDESTSSGGNFIDRWRSRINITKQHKKDFEVIIDRLRESSSLWTDGSRPAALLKLQSICIEFGEVEPWLVSALEDSSRWTSCEKNQDIRECMRILILQEACYALFANTMCRDTKLNDELAERRSIRNMLSVERVLRYFSLNFLQVSYYARLAMSLKDQNPAMVSLLHRAQQHPDPFVAATMISYYFEVRLQSHRNEGEGNENVESEIAAQATCDKKEHLVSYYGHMAFGRIRRKLRSNFRRRRHKNFFHSRRLSQSPLPTKSGHTSTPNSVQQFTSPIPSVQLKRNDSGTSNSPPARSPYLIERLSSSSISESTASAAPTPATPSDSTGGDDTQNMQQSTDEIHVTSLVDINALVCASEKRRNFNLAASNNDLGSEANNAGSLTNGASEQSSLISVDSPTDPNQTDQGILQPPNNTTRSLVDPVPGPPHEVTSPGLVSGRSLMEEIRLALRQDYVWKIRTIWYKYELDINDSIISFQMPLVSRRSEFEFLDGRRASVPPGSQVSPKHRNGNGHHGSLTSGCTILHAAIISNAHKITHWALGRNADIFVRHYGTRHTALAMLQNGAARSRSGKERIEKALASLPLMPDSDCAFGCGDIESFLFISTCKANRSKFENWLNLLHQGADVEDIIRAEETRVKAQSADQSMSDNEGQLHGENGISEDASEANITTGKLLSVAQNVSSSVVTSEEEQHKSSQDTDGSNNGSPIDHMNLCTSNSEDHDKLVATNDKAAQEHVLVETVEHPLADSDKTVSSMPEGTVINDHKTGMLMQGADR